MSGRSAGILTQRHVVQSLPGVLCSASCQSSLLDSEFYPDHDDWDLSDAPANHVAYDRAGGYESYDRAGGYESLAYDGPIPLGGSARPRLRHQPDQE